MSRVRVSYVTNNITKEEEVLLHRIDEPNSPPMQLFSYERNENGEEVRKPVGRENIDKYLYTTKKKPDGK